MNSTQTIVGKCKNDIKIEIIIVFNYYNKVNFKVLMNLNSDR